MIMKEEELLLITNVAIVLNEELIWKTMEVLIKVIFGKMIMEF
jgi:hypothetical protein